MTGAFKARWSLVLSAAVLFGCGEHSNWSMDGGVGKSDPETLERSSVRAAYIASQQAKGATDSSYRVDQLVAANPAQRFTTTFDAAGVKLAPASRAWELGLELKALGCGDRAQSVAALGKPSVTAPNRVEYERRAWGGEPFREWYENGPLGLEQGFTLSEPPCGMTETGAVTLVVRVEGLSARASEAASTELVDHSGQVRLRYSDLHSVDATGRALNGQMLVTQAGEVALRIETEGARWPIEVDPLVWGQERRLTASDGTAGDEFGSSVALSGDSALIGAYTDGVGANIYQGSAYVFVHSGTTWSEQRKLTASDGAASDWFGISVALSGDSALVGAGSDDVGANADQGSAYVFVRSGTTWSEQKKLTASDGAASDQFGTSVALSGDSALVGAGSDDVGANADQGSAYVFVRSGTTWSEQRTLTASDGAAGDGFGWSVALSGDSALVGAQGDDVGAGSFQGSAYVFVRSGTTWSEQKKLTASDGAANDDFGYSVSLSGDSVLVGLLGDDVGANAEQGSAYVFVRSGTAWSEQKKLTAYDGAANDYFGWSVALSGDSALVAAYGDDVGANGNQGSAYVFVRSGTSWSEQKRLTASDGEASDYFGYSVALSGDSALVGVDDDLVGANAYQGSAYMFRLVLSDGDVCSVDGDCFSNHCIDSVCCNIDCTGACAACSVAAGADSDGVCKVFAAGAVGSPACAPQACNGSSLDCAACVHDSECPGGDYCAADGTCQSQKNVGDACDLAQGADCKEASCAACSSGHCVDSVCCNSDCNETCQACSTALTGGADGTCNPIPTDQDPENECEPSAGYPNDCGADGSCSGQPACRQFAKLGVACGATTCSDAKVTGLLCSGEDTTCAPASDLPCAPYACDGNVCAASCASEADCDGDNGYCLDGACEPTLAEAAGCSDDVECQSGFCTDGVCCNKRCDGQCEACAEPGAEGTCNPIVGEPRGYREACPTGDGADPCSATLCDGADGSQCAGFVGSDVSCRAPSCTDGVATLDASCDAKGSCPAVRTVECTPHACAGVDCGMSCASNDDCASEFRCQDQDCVARDMTSCDKDHANQINPDGTPLACFPYLCVGIACPKTCTATSECATGNVCNPTSKSCEQAAQKSSDSGGCGCHTVGRSPGGNLGWLVLLGTTLLLRRRRLLNPLALMTRTFMPWRSFALGSAALLGCGEHSSWSESGSLGDKSPGALERSSVRAAYIATQQARGATQPAYRVKDFIAYNPGQRFTTKFGRSGVKIAPASSDWELGLELRAVGCGDRLETVTTLAKPIVTADNRIDYERRAGGEPVREWYVNGPLGLEQGFTLSEPPCSATRADAVTLLVGVVGLSAERASEGESIDLMDRSGHVRLRYSDLHSVDATGRTLNGQMVVTREGEAALRIETEGAKWPVVVDPLVWGQERKLTASDGATYDHFGYSVSLSGDLALVGALEDNVGANPSQGSAYVFARNGTTWSEQKKLTASDGAASDYFGYSVALSGDSALVGAYAGDVGANTNQGSAYLFARSGTTWSEQEKLTASDGAASDRFGSSVALSADSALVGAYQDDVGANADQGSAYVFVRSGTTWSEQRTLTASDGAAGDGFGWSVSLSGDTALVGAVYAGAAADQGSAYVFFRSGTTWSEQRTLTASDGAAGDGFGWSVSLSGDSALVGAYTSDVGAAADQGSAYVFVRSGTTWSEERKLTASDGKASDYFGYSVSLSPDSALVGAYRGAGSASAYQGSAYVFVRSGTTWSDERKLTASDGEAGAYFGDSVSLSGDSALVAAYGDDVGATVDQGSAYIFRLALTDGDVCSVDGDCLSNYCADGVCCNIDCTGACAACSVAAGADSDGVCKVFAPGAVGSPACAPQACNGSSLDCEACAHDLECPSGTYCATDATCQGQKNAGDACDLSASANCKEAGCAACSSGHCVDSVCCNSDCNETCQACSTALTGGANGACNPIPADQDPENECEPSAGYPNDCGADGSCSGQPACRQFAKLGVACGATTCSDAKVTGLLCSGEDTTCAPASDVPCAPYACDGNACATSCASEADCDGDSGYCLDGACEPTQARAAGCSEDLECQSDFCTDGVCCNKRCDGQCEACAEPGTEGTCNPIVGEPRGSDREACSTGDGTDPCTAALCDGADGSQCAGFVGSDVSCREPSCTDGVATLDASCDATGSCAAVRTVECTPHACAGADCGDSCASDEDCASEFRCQDQDCVARDTTSCDKDHANQINPNGTPLACFPYLCVGIACPKTCMTTSECASGYVCNPTSKSCERAAQKSNDSGGCGCRTVGRSSDRNLGWLALLGLGAALRRRKRSLLG